MGTNFYKFKPLPTQTKELLKQAIDNDKITINEYGTVHINIDKIIQPPKIHIGKRSAGWYFLFDHNNWKYFTKNKQSLVNWINDPNTGIIKDEENRIYTSEEFWKEVYDTYNLWYGRKPWDSESYNKWAKENGEYTDGRIHDFKLEDLRISNFTDFS